MHAAKKYQVRQEARMEFRIGDAYGGVGERESSVGRKWSETKGGPKLRKKGRVEMFVNTL
jgi:hypothetical protein